MANDFFDELGMTISKKAKDLGGKAETLYERRKRSGWRSWSSL